MQDRETNEIKTPVTGKVVVLKAYLTGREKRDITNASLPTTVDYDQEDGVKGLNPIKIMNDGEDMTLRTVIVSIDGQTGIDFADAVLSMRSEESDYVIREVKKIVDGLSAEKKTT